MKLREFKYIYMFQLKMMISKSYKDMDAIQIHLYVLVKAAIPFETVYRQKIQIHLYVLVKEVKNYISKFKVNNSNTSICFS